MADYEKINDILIVDEKKYDLATLGEDEEDDSFEIRESLSNQGNGKWNSPSTLISDHCFKDTSFTN